MINEYYAGKTILFVATLLMFMALMQGMIHFIGKQYAVHVIIYTVAFYILMAVYFQALNVIEARKEKQDGHK